MKDIRGSVFGMMGFYFIMSACFIRGIPTYTEELMALLSLISAPHDRIGEPYLHCDPEKIITPTTPTSSESLIAT